MLCIVLNTDTWSPQLGKSKSLTGWIFLIQVDMLWLANPCSGRRLAILIFFPVTTHLSTQVISWQGKTQMSWASRGLFWPLTFWKSCFLSVKVQTGHRMWNLLFRKKNLDSLPSPAQWQRRVNPLSNISRNWEKCQQKTFTLASRAD